MPTDAGYTCWNIPHITEEAIQADSYARSQLTGMIAAVAGYGCRYLRAPWQFSQHFNNPTSISSGTLFNWWCYTCFQYDIIPMVVHNGHPNTGVSAWNNLLPNDGRYRHINKPESEHVASILNCHRIMYEIIATEATRVGVPLSQIPVQAGNELGKGGSGDWRPYPAQSPANPEAASADGRVPSSVVSFTSSLLSVIREYGFIAVSPAMEAETTTILTEELNSPGWLSVINSFDKIAVHSYPETSGNRNRCHASSDAITAFNARKTVIRDTFGITKPIWVTEIGRLQSECKPAGTGVGESLAATCKKLGAEEAFPFVICMDGSPFATNVKTDFNTTPLTYTPA